MDDTIKKTFPNHWKNKVPTNLQEEWVDTHFKGENNPNYKNAKHYTTSNNPNATIRIITSPQGFKYFCNGNYTNFCSKFCAQFKPNPARKFFEESLKTGLPVNGWLVQDVEYSVNTDDCIIYKSI
jgi:hypothetical protein